MKHFKQSLLINLTSIVVICGFSYAQNTFIEEGLEYLLFQNIPTVTTASKKEESIDRAPNTMYSFNAAEIRHRGFRKLEDLISIIPGMAAFHRDLQVVGQVRGVAPNDNEKIAVMIDGHIINNLTQPEVMIGPINFEAVERVEVIVGPGSVLYGPETLLAIVNLITKKMENNEIILFVGEDELDTNGATINLGKKWDENQFITLSGSYMERAGFDLQHSGTDPRTDSLYKAGGGHLYPSVYFNGLAKFDDWTFQAMAINSQLFHLNQEKNHDLDRRRFDYITSWIISKDTIFSDNVIGTFRGSYDTKRQVWGTVDSIASASVWDFKIADPFDYEMSQYVYNMEYSLQYKGERHFLQGGIQYSHKQNRHNYILLHNPDNAAATDTDVAQLVDHKDTDTIGVYLSEEFTVNDSFNIVGAIRADRDSSLLTNKNKTYVSPRVVLVYTPIQSWISKVSYNTATRIPTPWNGHLNTLWGSDKIQFPPFGGNFGNRNPAAEKPEVLTAIEWQNIFYVGKARLSINAYIQELEDYITWFNPFTNAGNFEGEGVEIDFNYNISHEFRLRAGATFLNTTIKDPIPVNPNSPHHAVNNDDEMLAAAQIMANMGFDWGISENIHFSSTVRYFTHQPYGFQNPGDVEPQYGYINDQYYLDATLNFEQLLNGKFDVEISGRNLLDNDDPVATPQQLLTHIPRGTEVIVSIKARF